MKNVLIIFMMLATFAVSAQKMDSDQNAQPNYTVAQRIDLNTKEMTLKLDLNQSQQEKVKALMTEMSKTMPVKTENKAAMNSDEKYAKQSARIDQKIEFKNKLKDILTPEQMATWEKEKMGRRIHSRKMRHFQGKKEK